MLHYLSFAVPNFARSSAVDDAVLTPPGYRRICEDAFVFDGIEDSKDLKLRPENLGVPDDGFFEAALRHSGMSNRGSGLRRQCGPNYLTGFALAPDGYRVEAVIVDPNDRTTPSMLSRSGLSIQPMKLR